MRLQGFPCYGCERACLWDKGFALECLRFYERFIGFHSPLRGNPLNVFAIISLITISALGQSLDLTKIRNWKLLSQYKAINLCHPCCHCGSGKQCSFLTYVKLCSDFIQDVSIHQHRFCHTPTHLKSSQFFILTALTPFRYQQFVSVSAYYYYLAPSHV